MTPLDDLITLAKTDPTAFKRAFELSAKLAAEHKLAAMLKGEPSAAGPASKRFVLTMAADLAAVVELKADMHRAAVNKRLSVIEAALGITTP